MFCFVLKSNLSPQGSGVWANKGVERLHELEARNDSKETVSFRHNRSDLIYAICTHTETLTEIERAGIKPVQIQIKQNPGIYKRKQIQSPTTN